MNVKAKSYKSKRQLLQEGIKLEEKHYRIFITLAIFACTYHYFFQPKTIGNDIRYNIFIFWLPIITGIISISFYRRKFIVNKFSTNKGFALWTFMTVFYTIQGLIASYLIFGQIAQISWDIANQQMANKNRSDNLDCDIIQFYSRRSPYSIVFKFNKKYETINVDYKTIKSYVEQNPKEYKVVIAAQKGLWNHYLINDWTIQKK